MEQFNYIGFLFRNWKSILIVTILVAISAGVFGVIKNKTVYQATVFINIGAKQNNQNTSLLEAVQAADQFTETIQGWFKDPSFLSKISNDPTGISARKQEKQNLIVEYEKNTREEATNLSSEIKHALQEQLENYNAQTQNGFTLGVFSTTVTTKNYPIGLVILLGIIGGFVAGQVLFYVFEYLSFVSRKIKQGQIK